MSMNYYENLMSIADPNEVTLIGIPAYESEITLAAIESECDSIDEFANILEACGTEMALYDVIADADIATEAVKKIQIKDWKGANFDRVKARTAIRLAMVNNDPLYTKYKMYRDKMLEVREKIYTKYASKANKETKIIIKNSRNKAANMSSATSRSVTDKMDRAIAKAEHKPVNPKKKK